MNEVFFLEIFFFKYITKQIWIFVITKLFFYIPQSRFDILTNQNHFFNNKNISDFFNKKKRFHPFINLCDLIFHSHIQHIMHDMHSIVHWSQESRRPDLVWVEWVPNIFLFRNLASGFSFFGLVDLALSLFVLGRI